MARAQGWGWGRGVGTGMCVEHRAGDMAQDGETRMWQEGVRNGVGDVVRGRETWVGHEAKEGSRMWQVALGCGCESRAQIWEQGGGHTTGEVAMGTGTRTRWGAQGCRGNSWDRDMVRGMGPGTCCGDIEMGMWQRSLRWGCEWGAQGQEHRWDTGLDMGCGAQSQECGGVAGTETWCGAQGHGG